jgi:hypothetical protein
MFRREEAALLRDQLLQQFDRALAIDLPDFAVAFPGFNDGPKPRKARLRQEINAAALQKRDNRKIQRLVRTKLTNRPLDDRQELVEVRPTRIDAADQRREIRRHAKQKREGGDKLAIEIFAATVTLPFEIAKQPIGHGGPQSYVRLVDFGRP